MTLGKKLAGLRKGFGVTQQQLGDILSVSAQAVSKWENDQAEPDLQTLKRLCTIYKIKLDDLFGDEPEQPSPSAPPAPPAETPAEAAAEKPAAAPVQAEAPVDAAAAPKAAEKPKLIGYCTDCGCAVFSGTEKRLSTGLYCTMCYAKKLRKARELVQKARSYDEEKASAQAGAAAPAARKPDPYAMPINGAGVAGLVLGILSTVLSSVLWLLGLWGMILGTLEALAALGFSIRGVRNRMYCSAPGVPITGLVFSIIGLAGFVLVWILFLIGLSMLSAMGYTLA